MGATSKRNQKRARANRPLADKVMLDREWVLEPNEPAVYVKGVMSDLDARVCDMRGFGAFISSKNADPQSAHDAQVAVGQHIVDLHNATLASRRRRAMDDRDIYKARVDRFSRLMLDKLNQCESKGLWDGLHHVYLLGQAQKNLSELVLLATIELDRGYAATYEEICDSARDVANLVMMVADLWMGPTDGEKPKEGE